MAGDSTTTENNSYILNAESPTEMARLIDLDRVVTAEDTPTPPRGDVGDTGKER